jgi:hypothetical protein
LSATPVTVTVLTEFQFEAVKTSCEVLSGDALLMPEMEPSPASDVAIVIVTLSEDGALERLTVKKAVFKFSSVSPEI